MDVTVIGSLEEVSATEWNVLADESNPFIRHEFLVALERHHCVGPRHGWVPQHILIHDKGKLVGAVPMYLKDNSYGEFVFDWAWAHAYERAGLKYYPKLVVGVPYTPAPSQRILVEKNPHCDAIANLLIDAAQQHANNLGVSSLHWLFTTEQETSLLEARGLLRRTGCQFHWNNKGYTHFDDFLETFTAQKRKKVKRERRRIEEAGIEIEILNGGEITASQWQIFHRFYELTFHTKGGIPTLTLDFFNEIGRTMAENIVLVLAKYQGRYVAGAFNIRGKDTLFGRHWGCDAEFHSLHFEACYYQGIDYCIQQGLKHFQPGAQGEHKVSRGFEPTLTYSAHWIGNPSFRKAIADFLKHEQAGVNEYKQELDDHLPFKLTSG